MRPFPGGLSTLLFVLLIFLFISPAFSLPPHPDGGDTSASKKRPSSSSSSSNPTKSSPPSSSSSTSSSSPSSTKSSFPLFNKGKDGGKDDGKPRITLNLSNKVKAWSSSPDPPKDDSPDESSPTLTLSEVMKAAVQLRSVLTKSLENFDGTEESLMEAAETIQIGEGDETKKVMFTTKKNEKGEISIELKAEAVGAEKMVEEDNSIAMATTKETTATTTMANADTTTTSAPASTPSSSPPSSPSNTPSPSPPPTSSSAPSSPSTSSPTSTSPSEATTNLTPMSSSFLTEIVKMAANSFLRNRQSASLAQKGQPQNSRVPLISKLEADYQKLDELSLQSSDVIDNAVLTLSSMSAEELVNSFENGEILDIEMPLTEDEENAFEYFDKGEMYYNGTMTGQKDLVKAMEMFEKAASYGLHDAMVAMGEMYLLGSSDIKANFSAAEYWFEQAADLGDSMAMHYLAFIYHSGISPRFGRDIPRSLLYDQFSALSGYVPARMSSGYRHLHGENVPLSCENAVRLYEQAALEVTQEIVDDPFHIHEIDRSRLIDERARQPELMDEVEIVEYYKDSAAAGDINANLALGNMAQHGGHGMDQDPQVAAQYYKVAAEAGEAQAMAALAQLHVNGRGVPQDNETAFELFHEAATRGNAAAMNGLGVLYLHGIGTPSGKKDPQQALQWFRRSADGGYAEGMFNLGVMLYQGTGTDPNPAVALQWFTSAALHGHTRAMFNMGAFHLNGVGTAPSCPTAVAMFKQVAEKGQPGLRLTAGKDAFLDGAYDEAFIHYAMAAFEGQEVGQSNAAWLLHSELVNLNGYFNAHPRSMKEFESNSTLSPSELQRERRRQLRSMAFSYLLRSADQGAVDNFRLIGDYHYDGLLSADGSPNYVDAFKWYSKGSTFRQAESDFNLGYMYQWGLGVPKDLHLAKRYYDEAIECDPLNAYWPSTLALWGMQGDLWWQELTEWWEKKSSPPEPISPFAQSTSLKPQVRSVFSHYETLENVVLLVLCAALAVVIYIRSQRI